MLIVPDANQVFFGSHFRQIVLRVFHILFGLLSIPTSLDALFTRYRQLSELESFSLLFVAVSLLAVNEFYFALAFRLLKVTFVRIKG